MKFVLHLKHWQLFLVVYGIPFAIYISIFATMFATVFAVVGGQPDINSDGLFPGFTIGFGILFVTSWLAAIVTLVSWMFQVGTGLYKKRPADSTLKIKRFYFAFFYPAGYMLFILLGSLCFVLYMTTIGKGNEPDPSAFMWLLLIIPFHLFCMVCLLYTIYFVGKALKSVELGREAIAGEYISECVLVWMFFVGIWFIQPKVNKIFGEESTLTSPS